MTKAYAEVTVADATITTTTELAGSSLRIPGVRTGEEVILMANVTVIGGAGTTGCNITIREGSGITGTIVGELNLAELDTAGDNFVLSIIRVAVANIDDPEYVVTVQLVGASGNGTLSNSAIVAIRTGD